MTDPSPTGPPVVRARRWRVPSGFLLGVAVGTAVGVVATVGWYAATREQPLERGQLVILSGKDTSPGGQRDELVKLWNELHPESPARIRPAPVTTDQQHSEMAAVAQAQATNPGQDPENDVDIYNLDVTFTAEFAAAGYLRPIDESRLGPGHLDAFVPEVLDGCRYQGSLWALPFNTDAGLLFYRPDLLGAAGPGSGHPRFDWDAVIDRGRALAGPGRGAQASMVGYVGQFGPYEGLTVNGMELIWSAGVDRLVDETQNRVVFQRDRWERRLRDVATARPAGLLVGDAFAVPGDEARSLRDFREGRALFMRNWPVNYRSLSSPDAVPATPVPFEVTLLPGPSALGGQNLAVAKHTRQPRAAQALVEFLTRKEAQRKLFALGGFAPTRVDVYADPQLREQFPYLPLLADAVGQARTRPRVPHYFQFSRVFREGVRRALEGDGSLPENFEAQLNQALQGG
ncbi:extracellular solute-binding protein [Micromonospora halophytica]|uniref:Carbohydrate ABC transporter substrate-binding protein, CUT1 family n=1 Tax=Micromonospora halophytica TaxID=47864 RepID=A0A1C5I0L4_9ACTN|nr:extracellular solute-binding protein [Micromonospora halophytica]SCG51775.1 carbohydrate ABC transporter substrate-binding protein, CUT1 family [Micromonospora halophytica]